MSVVQNVILAELQEKIQLSRNLADIVEKAKTKAKKDHYKRKLHKNNLIVADLLSKLDKLNKKQETLNVASD